VKIQTSSLPLDLIKMYMSHVWMKNFIICSEIVLGSWIKHIGFDLCHKDLGTIFARYRPSQDNCSKQNSDIKLLDCKINCYIKCERLHQQTHISQKIVQKGGYTNKTKLRSEKIVQKGGHTIIKREQLR
jgi:hypothetical protein